MTSQYKIWFMVQLLATLFMGMFGAEAIGKVVPSILALALIGLLFSMASRLMSPSRSLFGADITEGYLGLKHPILPLIVFAGAVWISFLLIFGRSATEPRDFVWAFLGGVAIFVAINQFLLWTKVRKLGRLQ